MELKMEHCFSLMDFLYDNLIIEFIGIRICDDKIIIWMKLPHIEFILKINSIIDFYASLIFIIFYPIKEYIIIIIILKSFKIFVISIFLILLYWSSYLIEQS